MKTINITLMAIAGLLALLHAQFEEGMVSACFEGMSVLQQSQNKIETGSFYIYAPTFEDSEQYEFIWEKLKNEPDPVVPYQFTSES